MLQTVAGRLVYVVEIKVWPPELPITGVGMEQKYARSLTLAIIRGQIPGPGKYAIEVDFQNNRYDVFRIDEPLGEGEDV
jgi:hypothetical protein